jgi:hypothetical protein
MPKCVLAVAIKGNYPSIVGGEIVWWRSERVDAELLALLECVFCVVVGESY